MAIGHLYNVTNCHLVDRMEQCRSVQKKNREVGERKERERMRGRGGGNRLTDD